MSNIDESERIKSWCALHDPKHIQLALVGQEPTFSMLAVGGIEQPVTVNVQITGDWRYALARDSEVRRNIGKSGLLDAFKNSPATGCTTIMDMARISSGFNPLQPLQTGNYYAFMRYISILEKSPFFTEYPPDNQQYHRKDDDWNGVVNDIASYYQGVTDSDKNRIRSSLYDLISASTSRHDTWQKKTLFVQNTIKVERDNIFVYIYNSNVALTEHGGKHTSTEVYFNITRIMLRFDSELWSRNAETVANRHMKSVNDWLNDNSTQGDNQFSLMRAAVTGFSLIERENSLCLDEIPGVTDAIKSGNVNEYWRCFSWDDFSSHMQNLWSILGWNNSSWDRAELADPTSYNKAWEHLTPQEQQAAKALGYSSLNWKK